MVKKHSDKNGARKSSTVSREATSEDVYMTQRAQKAILAGKKKKKDQEYNFAEHVKLASKISAENYFEGT